jgi:hypothetical protein
MSDLESDAGANVFRQVELRGRVALRHATSGQVGERLRLRAQGRCRWAGRAREAKGMVYLCDHLCAANHPCHGCLETIQQDGTFHVLLSDSHQIWTGRCCNEVVRHFAWICCIRQRRGRPFEHVEYKADTFG